MKSPSLYRNYSLLVFEVKYRTRIDIISKILESAMGRGLTKSKIMQEALLSSSQLKGYLSVLVERNLLEFIQDQALYRTTEKGMKYLDAYTQIHELAGDLRQVTV
jgi:predicted transcriptional regulator